MIAEIVGLPAYEAKVAALMDDDERLAMEFFIACTAQDHPLMKDTGGFRKARWARPGSGKSGGYRVIYFFVSEPGRVYLASIYAKSEKQNLTAAERKVLSTISRSIKAAVREELE